MPQSYFVTGTDTGIGKTIDSAKDKPNKTLFVVLLDETSLILS